MKTILGAVWPYLLAVACAAAVLYWAYHAGYEAADSMWKGSINEANLATAMESASQEREQRRIEGERTKVAETEQAAAEERTKVDSATADALSADVAGLLKQAGDYAAADSRVCSPASPADSGEGTRRAAMVLSDLLSRSIERNQELARAYDKLRTAALTCQNTYNRIQKGK